MTCSQPTIPLGMLAFRQIEVHLGIRPSFNDKNLMFRWLNLPPCGRIQPASGIFVQSAGYRSRFLALYFPPGGWSSTDDRLAHRSYVVDMSGESYRIRETRLWMQLKGVDHFSTD
jgi:hypothetical protein